MANKTVIKNIAITPIISVFITFYFSADKTERLKLFWFYQYITDIAENKNGDDKEQEHSCMFYLFGYN